MTIFSPLIWKSHKRRLESNVCPHCGRTIKWIYDGVQYFPCDEQPVLFTMHPDGKQTLIYKKRELDHCVIYNKNDPKCSGVPFKAHIQHYYTCPVLCEQRRRYIEDIKRGQIR